MDLVKFIKGPKGSRWLQKELNSISPENLEELINKISPHLSQIMNDTYGNYFSQKLIQSCTAQQRLTILKSISKELVNISMNNAGTHSIQCLVEIINLREEEEIIKDSIKHDILKISYDINSTHVMQKIVLIIAEENREYITHMCLKFLPKMVLDPNGICVIKKIINGNKNLDIRNKIIELIKLNGLEIIQNPYGNYIIQHVLDVWGCEYCKSIIKIIHDNIISLSMQKFSSNVVEKCLDLINPNLRKQWIKDIFNYSKISSIVKNKYGNFVLQKSIMVMSQQEKDEIKQYLTKKISIASNKEKTRIQSLIDLF